MQDYYYICALVAYGIFIGQFILSLIGTSDIDIDVPDTSVDTGMSMSDIVSFKGILHFATGFFTWLWMRSRVGIEWYDYLIAVLVGVLFVYLLYKAYKLCMKLEHAPKRETPSQLVGKPCEIYVKLSDTSYSVSLIISGSLGYRDVTSKSGKVYKTGEKTSILSYENGILFIQ